MTYLTISTEMQKNDARQRKVLEEGLSATSPAGLAGRYSFERKPAFQIKYFPKVLFSVLCKKVLNFKSMKESRRYLASRFLWCHSLVCLFLQTEISENLYYC